jgi:hypothetical protein
MALDLSLILRVSAEAEGDPRQGAEDGIWTVE